MHSDNGNSPLDKKGHLSAKNRFQAVPPPPNLTSDTKIRSPGCPKGSSRFRGSNTHDEITVPGNKNGNGTPPKTYRRYGDQYYEVSPGGMMIPPGMIRNPGRYLARPSDTGSKFEIRNENSSARNGKAGPEVLALDMIKASLAPPQLDREVVPNDSRSIACASGGGDSNDTPNNGMDSQSRYSADWASRVKQIFLTVERYEKVIRTWISTVSTADMPVLLHKIAWKSPHCDIHPSDGRLLVPTDYPATARNDELIEDEAMRKRRWTQTANSACKAYTLLHGLEEQDDELDTRESSMGDKCNDMANEEPAHETASGQAATKTTTAASTCDPPASADANAGFYMRLANEADLSGVQEIYNLEVAKGTQATDFTALSVDEIGSILSTCRRMELPFIVALGKNEEMGGSAEKVLAFGFLSVYQLGLAGGLAGTSKHSVKVNLFVHARYRQRGVGGALMNVLMQMVSASYRPKKQYNGKFTQSLSTDIYQQSRWVFVEVLYGSVQGLAELWYDRVLRSDFNFQPCGKSMSGALWSSSGKCWLTKHIYRHDCVGSSGPAERVGGVPLLGPCRGRSQTSKPGDYRDGSEASKPGHELSRRSGLEEERGVYETGSNSDLALQGKDMSSFGDDAAAFHYNHFW